MKNNHSNEVYVVEPDKKLIGVPTTSYTVRKWTRDINSKRREEIQHDNTETINSANVRSRESDLTIADIRKILGCGKSAAYENTYYGEYRHNCRRMVRREIFMHRREMGLDVCIK